MVEVERVHPAKERIQLRFFRGLCPWVWLNFSISQWYFVQVKFLTGNILTLTRSHLKECGTTFPSVLNSLHPEFPLLLSPRPTCTVLLLNFTFCSHGPPAGWSLVGGAALAPSTRQELRPLELLRPHGTRRLNAWTSWRHYGPTPPISGLHPKYRNIDVGQVFVPIRWLGVFDTWQAARSVHLSSNITPYSTTSIITVLNAIID